MRLCELSSDEEIEVLLDEIENLVQTRLDSCKEFFDYVVHFHFLPSKLIVFKTISMHMLPQDNTYVNRYLSQSV